MAASTVTDYVDGLLKRVYNDDVRDWFLNTNAEFFTKLQSCKLVPTEIGDGFYWPFKFQTAQNISTPADGSGNIPTSKVTTVKQGLVRLAEFIGSVEVGILLDAVGKGAGAWKAVVKEEMGGCLTDITKHVNRVYAGTHGTGRVFVVNATVTATTVVGKLPWGSLFVRPNMSLEQYTADTSGSIVGTAFTVTKNVRATRTITTASQTYTADQGLYLAGSYGTAPNGLAGIVDDGTNLTTLHGQSRSTYEEMKAIVSSNSGVVRDLTEDLLIRNTLDVYQASGENINCIVLNSGQLEKYLAFMRPDRRLNVTGSDVPKYNSGFQEGIKFQHGATQADVYLSSDVAPRSVYGLTLDKIRRIGDARPDWLDLGGGIFQQGVNSTGYKTSKVATMKFFSNIANMQPNAHFRIDDLSDPQLCGAGVGGTDV